MILSLVGPVILVSALIGCMSQGLHQGETKQRLEASVDAARKALQNNPTDSRVYAQLGTFLQHLDFISPDGGSRIPEAEQAYLKAVELSGGEPRVRAGLYGNLGALLMGAAGRLEDALDYTEKSIEAGKETSIPDASLTAGSYFNRGKILGMLGMEEEAQEAYREAVQMAAGVAPGSFAKALASLKGFNEDTIAAMEEAVRFLNMGQEGEGEADAPQEQREEDEDEDQPRSRRRRRRAKPSAASSDQLRERWHWLADIKPEDKPWIYFAMHRAYHSKADYDKAWGYLVEANKLQRETYLYNPEDESRIVHGLQQAFPVADQDEALKMALQGGAGSLDDTPIFVVGLPRSGSTLVEQILASHPSVYGAGEDTAFAPLLPKLFKALQTATGSPAGVGDEYVEKMRARVPEGRNVTRIVDKMLRNAFNLGYVQLTLPKACILHTVRHPLDVALSCFSQPFEGRGLPWAAQLDEIGTAIKNHHDIMAHWEALLPGRVLHVPYELLVEDQEGWSRRLLRHCGLPWDDRVLDFHKTARDVQTASLGQVRQKLYTTAIGKWRNYEEQLQPLVTDLHEYVERYESGLGRRQAHDEL